MSNYVTGHAIGVYSQTPRPETNTGTIKYDKITFYGGDTGNGAIIDKVYGTNNPITQDTVIEYSALGKELYWEDGSYLMCWFENTLNGGNVTGNVEHDIINWSVYRTDIKEGDAIKLADVPGTQHYYTDYTALAGHTYRYWVVGSTAEYEGEIEVTAPLVSDDVDCDYIGWFVIDPENEQVFAFNLNEDGGTVTSVENTHEYTTDGRYNVYSRGNTKYMSGTVSAILYEYLDDFKQSVEFLDKFRDFIYSTRTAYVKDRKGRIYKAFLSGYSESQFSHDPSIPMNITFTYNECGDVHA